MQKEKKTRTTSVVTKTKKSAIKNATNTNKRLSDPYLARETEKYEYPLPSREFIAQVLEEAGHPMDEHDLVQLLSILPEEGESFSRRLAAMERDGQLMRNRRGDFILPDKAALIRGRVEGHPDGYGFLIPDDGSADMVLGPKSMREVLHGDRVLARAAGVDHRGRQEAKIVEVLDRANKRLVGRVVVEQGVAFVAAENQRINQDILLAPDSRTQPKSGDVVMVELLQQPTQSSKPIGRIVETLGAYADPGMEIEIALRKHDLPFEFSEATQKEAEKLPEVVRKKDWTPGREDIRHLPLVTIDGETARDFDDAVYCERQGKGYRLIVAIADVSHYVTPGAAIDSDALARGNSVYFPRRVIPMLPERLSNGLCSLNPKVERLCMVCDMDIGPNGDVKKYRFYPGVMYSHMRLTYNKVAAALYDKDPAVIKEIGELMPHLENLDLLFRQLLKARAKRGAMDFETLETRMNFDEYGKIESIVPEKRNDAHKVIEECMLAANVCASDFLQKHEHPALYRVHEGPTPEKLDKLRRFLAEFGLGLGGGDTPTAGDFAKVIDKIKGRPDVNLIQTVMLRSLQQAVYSPENVGHFGLAYEAYTHFTSPIRRYPDLLVHRAIKAVLLNKRYVPANGPVELLKDTRRRKKGNAALAESAPVIKKDAKQKSPTQQMWEDIGMHCSMTERRADDATRDVDAWLKCFYMQDRVGEEFTGNITAVVPFGIFVTLDHVFVEGLVHISDLGKDYFHHDEARHELVGERTGQRYRLSDRVTIQVVRVDMEMRKMDFRLVEPESSSLQKKSAASVSIPGEEVASWRKLAGLPEKAASSRKKDAAPAKGRKPEKSGKANKAAAAKSAKAAKPSNKPNKPVAKPADKPVVKAATKVATKVATKAAPKVAPKAANKAAPKAPAKASAPAKAKPPVPPAPKAARQTAVLLMPKPGATPDVRPTAPTGKSRVAKVASGTKAAKTTPVAKATPAAQPTKAARKPVATNTGRIADSVTTNKATTKKGTRRG